MKSDCRSKLPTRTFRVNLLQNRFGFFVSSLAYQPTGRLRHEQLTHNDQNDWEDATHSKHEPPLQGITDVVKDQSSQKSQNDTNIDGHLRPGDQLTTMGRRRHFRNIQWVDCQSETDSNSDEKTETEKEKHCEICRFGFPPTPVFQFIA